MPSRVITFLVPGEDRGAEGATRGSAAVDAKAGIRGRVKHSVRVASQRGGGEVRIAAVPGKDVVVLEIAGGPTLTLHPENARDLLMSQSSAALPRGAQRKGARDEVRVTPELRWRALEHGAPSRGATRGFLGDVLLSAIRVVTDLVTDAAVGKAAKFAASQVVQRVDAQVEAGVYRLQSDELSALKGSALRVDHVPAGPAGRPHLVLVHGTFSETSGSFGKLWSEHPERVRDLFRQYESRVYALDHPTLGVSPIANALTLADAMPRGARLHLLTHSRGGLVAEVLARIAATPEDRFVPFAGRAHAAEREELRKLSSIVADKGLKVERIVRVACPARGTLLASKRLDAYVSVFQWTLKLAGIPVLPALVDFLGAVAKVRADPAVLPGLAAQIPDSPLVRWLHDVHAPIAGELRVIAGDLEGDSVGSWLKTLLADSFYWTDNDLVVQTRLMYGGAPRAASARFLLHQGGQVSHFNYFKNERTAAAIVHALLQDDPEDFRAIGPLSAAGQSATGVRAARRAVEAGSAEAEKPAVFLLPGILGSNLKVGDDRIWLGWRLINGLQRLAYAPGKADGVEPDGPIGTSYDALGDFLSDSHEVIEFAFDWRRPIEEEARRLSVRVSAALDARGKTGQPVRMLAHSMGGLVARALHLEAPKVWQRMMAQPGARLLMLGTPNGGSWAPMQVLSGDDVFGNTLAAVGAPFRDGEARELMASFPGFLQLQAGLLDDEHALGRRKTWESLAAEDLRRAQAGSWWHALGLQLDVMRWGVPSQHALDRAVQLRKRLDAQRDQALGAFHEQLLLVVGQARFTPDSFENGPDGFVYLDASEGGDGRVSLRNALLPGVRTWTLDCEHGGLPSSRAAFPAYEELLQRGTTNLLASLDEKTARGTAQDRATVLRSRPSRTRSVPVPPETEDSVLASDVSGPAGARAAPTDALRITVMNGDLTFVRQPLLLGHYRSTKLTGTEWVMDGLIGGTLKASLEKGLYPEPPGTHQVFLNTRVRPDNPWAIPKPAAVIVVGLGDEGNLSATDLVHTVRQAVIAWAQRVAEQRSDPPRTFELAATLIGSGGSGISVGQSALLIAQGVREANHRLENEHGQRGGWPRVGHLFLIELYLDRASEAWRALQLGEAARSGIYALTESVQAGAGALLRPLDSGYRGADYDVISAASSSGPNGEPLISYTLDTKRARAEMHAQHTQSALLRDLVVTASNDRNTDAGIGRTLFQLLVPLELEPFLEGKTEIHIELDRGTAAIPWELLDVGANGAQDPLPWAIRTKLLRKLRTATFRERVTDATAEASILIIGEPECDRDVYPELPGAREEANRILSRLTATGGLPGTHVRPLIDPGDGTARGPNSRAVISALMAGPWRIVHIAGHGELPELLGAAPKKPGDPPQRAGDPRGVVLSNGTFLGPREIRNMRTVPELVFVNCCHLAASDKRRLLDATGSDPLQYDRARFASGVAEELIEIGVRCVVAAGWAVDDGPALTFATTFYDALLRGARFIDAVGEARAAAFAQGGNTWAAYQCYGDPDWGFRRGVADAQRPSRPLADEFVGVASARGLCLALQTLAVRSRHQGARPDEQRQKIGHLESRFSERWGQSGEVAEAFGMAWLAANDNDAAMRWLERALAANDGSASIKAAEQLGNLRVRVAWGSVDAAERRLEELSERPSSGSRSAKSKKENVEVEAARRALSEAAAEARQQVSSAIDFLRRLTTLHSTAERESLLGSACKRLAMIESVVGATESETEAIRQMYECYRAAETQARKASPADSFYPAMNRMAAELRLNAVSSDGKGLDPDDVAAIREELQARGRDNPDFWSVVCLTELRLYESVAHGELERQRSSIESEYQDVHARMKVSWMWRSVYDQATFILSWYQRAAPENERRAARGLLEFLRELASPERAPRQAATSPAPTSSRPAPKRRKARRKPRDR